MHADDTGLSASNSDLQTLQDLINEHLSEIRTWLCRKKLPLNVIKIKYVILALKPKLAKIDQNPKILIQSKRLKE